MFAPPIYKYVQRPLLNPGGVSNYAFSPKFMLPLFTLPGPGTPYTFHWSPVQPEQMYYTLAQRMDGKIGIMAGQMALQPLIDNRDAGING